MLWNKADITNTKKVLNVTGKSMRGAVVQSHLRSSWPRWPPSPRRSHGLTLRTRWAIHGSEDVSEHPHSLHIQYNKRNELDKDTSISATKRH